MTRWPSLWDPLLQADFFTDLERRIGQGQRGIALSGLVEGSRALVLTLLQQRLGRPMLLVLPDDTALETYRRDLGALAALDGTRATTAAGRPQRVLTLPALDADPYDVIAPHPEVIRERLVALTRLLAGEADILLVPARAFLNLLPGPAEWRTWTKVVKPGDDLAPDRFVLQAMSLGYTRVDTVSAPGEVSRRGGIIDIFPPTGQEPVRIELFGDTVESMRSFHTDNQRSTGMLQEIVVGPASESPPTDTAVKRVQEFLEAGLHQAVGQDRTVRQIRELLDLLQTQGAWPGFESLAGMTAQAPALLFEYTRDMLLVVDEAERTDDELIRADHDLRVSYEQSANKVLPPPARLFGDAQEVRRILEAEAAIRVQELTGAPPQGSSVAIDVATRTSRAYSGRIHELADDVKRGRPTGARTVCLMRASGSAERLGEILAEYDIQAGATGQAVPPGAAGLFIGVASLRSGFELPDLGLTVLSEVGIFGEKPKTRERKSGSRAAFISDFRDLKIGDWVVHVDHGIARYTGLGRPRGGSLNRDFMVLEFADRNKLFVPVDRLDLVQKYTGAGGKPPQADRLGGPGWERVKAKVRKSVEAIAKDLLELYARRKAARGHEFGPDVPWQKELEAAFPYELTADQESAVAAIKQDMESPRTMDRLLVGDVGFGKTEVAVRAAFKAVMDGKQVAILTPTTVLSLQHLETITARYAPFPVRVEMVSRFRSAAETKKVLEDLRLGAVDVLIGTHRLLSKDVAFKQLGLLIVDEEQRFGVTHKERLKKMAVGIDVLSMSATPIPRTLQMSLAGVRDLSVIETPPPGRMAIKTYLIPFRKNVLAQAIHQELRRGGQVFVVHNRVQTLPAIGRAIQEMAPEARVVMAHGQMNEHMLERAMLRFVKREADVMVTTTIIENGLDIPDANTIIVNRADRFGLAQLYQLRGRVGRSSVHAYAYFVIPSRHNLSGEARRRLRALQEFSDLGAGFRLAAADLEIRGAGELLGAKQHGHIGALGFDLYCQMLERAVHDLKGEPVEEVRAVSLNLGIDIKVPQNYLPDAADRLVLYKRLASAQSATDIDALQAETEDRFGHLPQAAQNLFAMGRLRLIAATRGVKSVDLAEDTLQIRFHERPPIEPLHLLELVKKKKGTLSPSGMLVLPAPPRGDDRIRGVATLLRAMSCESTDAVSP